MLSSLVIGVVSKPARSIGVGIALGAWLSAVVFGPAPRGIAASAAFDSAADPTYNNQPDGTTGWVTGSNGGHGFGPWQSFYVPAPGSPLGVVASSTTNGTGDLDNDGDINTPRNASGRAWGFTAAPASDQGVEGTPSASRLFNSPLTAGQTFKIDMDNGFVADPLLSNGMHFPGGVGWELQGGTDTWEIEALGGAKDYLLNTPTADHLDTGIPLTYEGLHCELTMLGPSAISPFPLQWMLTVTPLSPGSQTYTFTGIRLVDPTQLVVGDNGGGLDPANAVYFNNISITDVPEPGTLSVLGAGAALLLRRHCRL